MQETMKEGLRLWLRRARMLEVEEILELVQVELQGRGVLMEYTIEGQALGGGPREEEG